MRIPGLLGVGLALAACSPAQPANPTPDAPDLQTRREVRVDTSEVRIGVGSEVAALQAVLALAPRATALHATSDTVHLRVGEIASFRVLPLTMVDSTGAALGALPIYDVAVAPGGVIETTGTGIRGVKAGLQSVTFRIPELFRGGRAGPHPGTVLQFLVHP
jgi:hypothetical protein